MTHFKYLNIFLGKLKESKNIFFYGFGDFIVTAVTSFLFIPLYLKFLSQESYGVLNILNNNLTLFNYIFQLGIVSAFSRIYHLKKLANREKQYTWYILIFHLSYSILLFLIYEIFNSFIVGWLSPAIDKSLLLLYYPVLMAFLAFIPAIYYVRLRMEQKAVIFVQYQILSVLFTITLIYLSYLFYQINLSSILASFLISRFIIWVIVIIKIKFVVNYKGWFNDIFETLTFAVPIFVGYIAYFFISKYNILILQSYLTLEELGRFSLALQISAIPTLISVAIMKALQPILFTANSDSDLKHKAEKLQENYKIFMIWVVGSLICSLDFLFDLYLPSSYKSALQTTSWLLLINLVYVFGVIENTVLLYKLKSKIILFVMVFSSLLNVVFSNILVQTFSVNGILVSMVTAFLLNFSLETYFSNKLIRLKYNVITIFIPLFIVVCYVILFSSNALLTSITVNKQLFSFLTLILLTIYSLHAYKSKVSK